MVMAQKAQEKWRRKNQQHWRFIDQRKQRTARLRVKLA
jgi:hypothetical protein